MNKENVKKNLRKTKGLIESFYTTYMRQHPLMSSNDFEATRRFKEFMTSMIDTTIGTLGGEQA